MTTIFVQFVFFVTVTCLAFKKISAVCIRVGESGVKWDKKIFLPTTRKIYTLHKKCLSYIVERVLFYFAKFFHGFGFLILPVIQFLRITKFFRNQKKWGVRWDRLCPKWDTMDFHEEH